MRCSSALVLLSWRHFDYIADGDGHQIRSNLEGTAVGFSSCGNKVRGIGVVRIDSEAGLYARKYISCLLRRRVMGDYPLHLITAQIPRAGAQVIGVESLVDQHIHSFTEANQVLRWLGVAGESNRVAGIINAITKRRLHR